MYLIPNQKNTTFKITKILKPLETSPGWFSRPEKFIPGIIGSKLTVMNDVIQLAIHAYTISVIYKI